MFHDNDAHFINGITLNVRDLRTLQPFYEELLGLKSGRDINRCQISSWRQSPLYYFKRDKVWTKSFISRSWFILYRNSIIQ